MPVVITAKKFYSEFALPTPFGDAGVTSLDKCVGDKIKAVIDFYIKWSAENILLRYDEATKKVTRANLQEFGSFITDGFKAGDTVMPVGGSNVTALTVASVTDRTMTFVETVVSETVEAGYIYGITSITSVDFYYNLSKNFSDASRNLLGLGGVANVSNQDFFSLVDRYTQQKYYADSLSSDTTGAATTMKIGTNSYGWVTDLSVGATGDNSGNTIIGMGTADYKQYFRITQYFFNVPTWLSGQLQNMQSDPPYPPEEYADTNCLKYICKIDAKFDQYDANVPHTGVDIDTNGLTSWFNETLNGRAPEYSMSSLIYRDVNTNEIIDAIDIEKGAKVEIIIHSKSGLFIDYNVTGGVYGTYIVLNYARCATDEQEYINTQTNWKENFHYDRTMIPLGLGTNGENYGTDYQVLEQTITTYVDAYNIRIDAVVNYSEYLKTILRAKDEADRQYMFWVTTEKRIL